MKMYSRRKYVSILLVISMCFMMLPNLSYAVTAVDTSAESVSETDELTVLINSLPETIDEQTAIAGDHVRRMYSEEVDLNTATFENADGSYTMYMYGEDIKYIDDSGNIVDKSNKLMQIGSTYINAANDIRVSYPNDVRNGILVSYKNYALRINPNVESSLSSNLLLASTVAEKITSTLQTTPDTIKYSNVFGQNTYVEYVQMFNGFKETIVVTKNNGQTEFSFTISTNGLRLVNNDGKLVLVDEADSVIATIGDLIMWDSNNRYFTGEYEIETKTEGQEYVLTINADAIVNDSKTVYPIYIDPSFTLGPSGIEDATIFTEYDSNAASETRLAVGACDQLSYSTASQLGTARTFIKMPILSTDNYFHHMYTTDLVSSVKFRFTETHDQTSSTKISAYMCDVSWTESTLKYSQSVWNNACETFIGSVTLDTTTSNATYEIDITYAVDSWRKHSSVYPVDKGIVLKMDSESTAVALICSTENSTTANRPCIVVNYNTLRNNSFYRLYNVGTSKYLDVENGHDKNNTVVGVKEDERIEDDNGQTKNYFGQVFRFSFTAAASVNSTAWQGQFFAMCSKNGRNRIVTAVNTTSGSTLAINGPAKYSSDHELFYISQIEPYVYTIALNSNENLVFTANSSGGVTLAAYSEGDRNQLWNFIPAYDENIYTHYYGNMKDIYYPFHSSYYTLSSDYGYRSDPVGDSTNKMHMGIDIEVGTENVALYGMFEGVVKRVVYDNYSGGNYVVVEATNSYHTVYGSDTKLRFIYMHMDSIAVSTGQSVDSETKIGIAGDTGQVTSIHLHLEIVTDGSNDADLESSIDPIMLFPNVAFSYTRQTE